MNPFLIGLFLPFALLIMWGWWVYSPPAFCAFVALGVLEAYARHRKARANEPPLPVQQPLPPVDVTAEALRAYRPPNGDVTPRPHAPKPRPYVGPPMKLPRGGLLVGAPGEGRSESN